VCLKAFVSFVCFVVTQEERGGSVPELNRSKTRFSQRVVQFLIGHVALARLDIRKQQVNDRFRPLPGVNHTQTAALPCHEVSAGPPDLPDAMTVARDGNTQAGIFLQSNCQLGQILTLTWRYFRRRLRHRSKGAVT